ncbi:hypothetical protein D7S44_05670 [Pantoea piersonii]|nr:hypothetical protein D7S44_05670 [Pantoea piersonii]
MAKTLKRFFKRLIKSLVSDYAPALLTFLFAVFLIHYFPEGPLWPVLIFFIFIAIIIERWYMKW